MALGATSSAPVFIVGCGRSGTTLLRLMLNTRPDLAIPQESDFMYQLMRLRARGKWPRRFDEIRDWQRLIKYFERHPSLARWGMSNSSLRERLECLPERTYAAAFRALFTEFMEQENKTSWGDKTPQHAQYLLVLDRLFPSARFVHVIRDGRDVALSLLTRRWGPNHIGFAGYYWSWLVLSGMVGGAILGKDRYYEVRYEDLVTDPESQLRSLCGWLGLEYRPEMLDYHSTKAANDYAAAGIDLAAKKLTERPDKRRVQRWMRDMSLRDQKSIMRQSGALLSYLGYRIDSLPRSQQHQMNRLRSLMQPQKIAELDREVVARTGRDGWMRYGLMLDRVGQCISLGGGRLDAWARGSIRWQRTVAAMMD